MGKLYAKRTHLGNIAFVLFLAFLAMSTLGNIPQAQAAVTPTHDGSLQSQVTPLDPAKIKDKSNSWQGTSATLRTSQDKTQVSFTIQVCTDQSFDSILLKILGIGDADMDQVTNAVYKVYDQVYAPGYYVYQFAYNWIYGQTLSIASSNDYTLQVYAAGTNLDSITLDLEAPPPEGGGGGGIPPVTPPTETTTNTGTMTTTDGQATLTVDQTKVEALIADTTVTQVKFEIPAASVTTSGTVAVAANTLDEVFDSGKSAVIEIGNVQLTLPPGAIDLGSLTEQGVSLNISVTKADPQTAQAPGDIAYQVAGEVYVINIRAVAEGSDKGGISTLSKPITLTLAYDPAKLGGASEDTLGVYRFNENTSTWDYVGGAVDQATNTVSVERSSLSKYAVMAYNKVFTDMTGHWAAADVKLMAARHIASGVTESTMAPDATVTRAQFTAYLLRAMNITAQAATGNRFKDVKAGKWYAGTVETAAAQGLVSENSDGTFKPEAPISREEVAAMITRALAKSGKSTALTDAEVKAQLAAFKDSGKVSKWARQAMALAIKEQILMGRQADKCAPKASSTRAEALVMIKRFLANTGKL